MSLSSRTELDVLATGPGTLGDATHWRHRIRTPMVPYAPMQWTLLLYPCIQCRIFYSRKFSFFAVLRVQVFIHCPVLYVQLCNICYRCKIFSAPIYSIHSIDRGYCQYLKHCFGKSQGSFASPDVSVHHASCKGAHSWLESMPFLPCGQVPTGRCRCLVLPVLYQCHWLPSSLEQDYYSPL